MLNKYLDTKILPSAAVSDSEVTEFGIRQRLLHRLLIHSATLMKLSAFPAAVLLCSMSYYRFLPFSYKS